MTHEQKQKTIFKVSEICNWPLDRFVITAAGDLQLLPKPDDHYQAVYCALRQIKPTNANLGFVGNEAPEERQ